MRSVTMHNYIRLNDAWVRCYDNDIWGMFPGSKCSVHRPLESTPEDPVNPPAVMLFPPDTRFYAGYTWVSEREDCKVGLCMPCADAGIAVRMFFARDARHYWNHGKKRAAWTLAGPDATPVRHEVTLGGEGGERR